MNTVINPKAPLKPATGEPCNGCGVCCIAEPCPVGIALFLKFRGTCGALIWSDGEKRYMCGALANPRMFIPWVPAPLDQLAGRLIRRWIAAGTSCDSNID
ncbi:MAG: hypothetical protein HY751_00500 [Nitrospinae bacterium]|nr:hypothetical protein [Nitrospinota bacterium]